MNNYLIMRISAYYFLLALFILSPLKAEAQEVKRLTFDEVIKLSEEIGRAHV